MYSSTLKRPQLPLSFDSCFFNLGAGTGEDFFLLDEEDFVGPFPVEDRRWRGEAGDATSSVSLLVSGMELASEARRSAVMGIPIVDGGLALLACWPVLSLEARRSALFLRFSKACMFVVMVLVEG